MKIREVDDLFKIWGSLLGILLLVALIGNVFLPNEPYSRTFKYNNTKYYVYLVFEDDFMIAGVRNDDDLQTKLINQDDALAENLIDTTKNPYKKYTFDAEKIIKFVLD